MNLDPFIIPGEADSNVVQFYTKLNNTIAKTNILESQLQKIQQLEARVIALETQLGIVSSTLTTAKTTQPPSQQPSPTTPSHQTTNSTINNVENNANKALELALEQLRLQQTVLDAAKLKEIEDNAKKAAELAWEIIRRSQTGG